jgi:hypothetical protein
MFSFKKNKVTTNVSIALENHINKMKTDLKSTWLLVKYAHQDKKISFHTCKLEGNVLTIGDIAYYVAENSIYYFNYERGKEKYLIPFVDIYEGITAGYNPFEERLTKIYNEKLQKAIYLHLKTGIMEQKLKGKMTMRNMIIGGMLAFVAIFIIIKMFM